MASTYPGTLDTFTDMGSTLNGPPTHSAVHALVHDAIDAIEGELGTNPSGSSATVAARFTALDSTISTNASTASSAVASAAAVAAAATAAVAQGLVAAPTTATSQVTFASVGSGAVVSQTATLTPGRYYRVRAVIPVYWYTAAGAGYVDARIKVGATTYEQRTVSFAYQGAYDDIIIEWEGTGSGSTAFDVTVSASSGDSGNIYVTATSTRPARISIYDEGAV